MAEVLGDQASLVKQNGFGVSVRGYVVVSAGPN